MFTNLQHPKKFGRAPQGDGRYIVVNNGGTYPNIIKDVLN